MATRENDGQHSTTQIAVQELLDKINNHSPSDVIEIGNLNLREQGDLALFLIALLRNKTEEEYLNIAHGLSAAQGRAEADELERLRLVNITELVMDIGSAVKGIDWG